MRQRIGVYGGTFDPIHTGHCSIADALIDAFRLDLMLLMPAFVPPHKRGHVISSAYHRMAMLALATAGSDSMFVSTIELDSPSRPYTIETLNCLQTQYPSSRLFFVMGTDSFRDVTMWRDYERILTEYSVIVTERPEQKTSVPIDPHPASHLSHALQQRVVDLRGGSLPAIEDLQDEHIYLTDYVSAEISSTEVRRRAAGGLSLDSMVPKAVSEYINKYRLYQ